MRKVCSLAIALVLAASGVIAPIESSAASFVLFPGTTTLLDSSHNQYGLVVNTIRPIVAVDDSLIFVIFRQFPTGSGHLAGATSLDYGNSWTIDYDINAPEINSRYPSAIQPYPGQDPTLHGPHACAAGLGGAGFGFYAAGGWGGYWQPAVQVIPNINCTQVHGVQLSDLSILFCSGGFDSIYYTRWNEDYSSELITPGYLWAGHLVNPGRPAGIDYRAGRIMIAAEVKSPWSPYQYVTSADNGITWSDTTAFPIYGLNDSILVDACFLLGNDGNPVGIFSVCAVADTIDPAWNGAYYMNSIVCCRADGSHSTVWARAGNDGGTFPTLSRHNGDTLFASWMATNDTTGWFGYQVDWDIYFAMSADGGLSWSTPINVSNALYASEAFPHIIPVGRHGASPFDYYPYIDILYATKAASDPTGILDIYSYYLYDAMGSNQIYNLNRDIPIWPNGVAGTSNQPTKHSFTLKQNQPNPASGATTLSFVLPRDGDYTMRVFNVAGQVVKEFSGTGRAGANRLTWNTGSAASGIYFYQLRSGGNVATKKLVVVK